jgi:hypothetical protein
MGKKKIGRGDKMQQPMFTVVHFFFLGVGGDFLQEKGVLQLFILPNLQPRYIDSLWTHVSFFAKD